MSGGGRSRCGRDEGTCGADFSLKGVQDGPAVGVGMIISRNISHSDEAMIELRSYGTVGWSIVPGDFLFLYK